MQKILLSGLMVIFVLGLIALIFKLVVVDVLAWVFRPLILMFAGDSLVIPLTILFTILLAILLGIPASHVKFKGIINKVLERALSKEKYGALVEKSEGEYYLAIIIMKDIQFSRLIGITEKLCLVFYPSTPVFWTSGLPIALVNEKKLISISSSVREIFATIATYGTNAPEKIIEIENGNRKQEKALTD